MIITDNPIYLRGIREERERILEILNKHWNIQTNKNENKFMELPACPQKV